MNKRDLVDLVAEQAELTKVQAARAIDAFLGGVQAGLKSGDRVALVGFGTFGLSERKARAVRDPRRGTMLQIPARRVARFIPGGELKAALNNGSKETPASA